MELVNYKGKKCTTWEMKIILKTHEWFAVIFLVIGTTLVALSFGEGLFWYFLCIYSVVRVMQCRKELMKCDVPKEEMIRYPEVVIDDQR